MIIPIYKVRVQANIQLSTVLHLCKGARGREFVFSFMANRIYSEQKPFGKIYVINPTDFPATVSVLTPLIFGPSRTQVTKTVEPLSSVFINTDSSLQLSGTQKEGKGIVYVKQMRF